MRTRAAHRDVNKPAVDCEAKGGTSQQGQSAVTVGNPDLCVGKDKFAQIKYSEEMQTDISCALEQASASGRFEHAK